MNRVIAAIDDMFFAAKVRGTAESLAVDVRLARTVDAVVELARDEIPALIIVDLHTTAFDPFELARQLKGDEKLKAIPLLGFFSHVQTELKKRAEDAGYDHVIPRSYFSKHLAEILEGSSLGPRASRPQ